MQTRKNEYMVMLRSSITLKDIVEKINREKRAIAMEMSLRCISSWTAIVCKI